MTVFASVLFTACTVAGRLEMCEMGNERRQLIIPVLVDAVVE